jgi:hypothetical protein
MPIKTDETGERWVEMDFLTPGTPEQVWQAMAGDGNAAWFMKADIEAKVGGAMRIDFGQGNFSSGLVTAWEPPHYFGYVEPSWAEGAPPCATEITIASRASGQCLVRMVHSLHTTSAEWDEQLEGFESGWQGFFEVLRIYLANYAGMKAASFIAMASASSEHAEAWQRLTGELGLSGANVGERRTAPTGPERWSGVVEVVHQDSKVRYVLLRLEGSSRGVAVVGSYSTGGNTTNVSLARYFYGDDADTLAKAAEPQWREWFRTSFESAS